ncbi:MAG: hypothetical protein HPY75_00765 [Actinobacteria bacterium]|nr:hypothetical protein [Actinomycetota bacterium]
MRATGKGRGRDPPYAAAGRDGQDREEEDTLEEKEGYRLSRPRARRGLEEEIARFSLGYALGEREGLVGVSARGRFHGDVDVASVKAGIFSGSIAPGDEVEGEAVASAYAAVYMPRAHYPQYVLGEMRAALRRGEREPAASPHFLPVSRLPAYPDGRRACFLYPLGKKAFDRPDFPAHVRDVLTRDYQRLPVLVPPGVDMPSGRVRFRGRLLQVGREVAHRLAGLGDRSYESYSLRGMVAFLEPSWIGEVDGGVSLRGSLFAEASLPVEVSWDEAAGALEKAVRMSVEGVFPPCEREDEPRADCALPHGGYHVTRFRRRLFAVVYDPVIAVFRAPRLLGIYLPCDLPREEDAAEASFAAFLARLRSALEEGLGLAEPVQVEMAHDNTLSWAREGGALRGPEFARAEEEHAFLAPTLRWLRGEPLQ